MVVATRERLEGACHSRGDHDGFGMEVRDDQWE